MPSALSRARLMGVALAFSDFELRLDSSRLLLAPFFASRLVPIRFQLFQADVDDAGKQFLVSANLELGSVRRSSLIKRSGFRVVCCAFRRLERMGAGFPLLTLSHFLDPLLRTEQTW